MHHWFADACDEKGSKICENTAMSLGNVIDGIQCNDFSKQKFECPNCCQGEEPEARLKECSWIYLNDWRWCCKVCVCNFWMEFFKFVSFSKVTREQDGARSVSFFDGWFGWFLYQESFDWQLSTVSLFAFQKAKRHRTEANLGTMCSYGWQGIEERNIFCLQHDFVEAEDWRDEPWEYKNEQYEACGGTCRAWNLVFPGSRVPSWFRGFSSSRTTVTTKLLELNGIELIALRHFALYPKYGGSNFKRLLRGILSTPGYLLWGQPPASSADFLFACVGIKKGSAFEGPEHIKLVDHCLSASWKMSSSLGEDPTACSFFSFATQCSWDAFLKVSTSWWGRLP